MVAAMVVFFMQAMSFSLVTRWCAAELSKLDVGSSRKSIFGCAIIAYIVQMGAVGARHIQSANGDSPIAVRSSFVGSQETAA